MCNGDTWEGVGGGGAAYSPGVKSCVLLYGHLLYGP